MKGQANRQACSNYVVEQRPSSFGAGASVPNVDIHHSWREGEDE